MYKKYDWNPKKERKWTQLSDNQRKEFAEKVYSLLVENNDIKVISIIVKKENVQSHIRTDENKLYNYMVKLSLVQYIKTFSNVYFHPDPKAIKVASGNSLHDYIQSELWFEENAKTILKTKPIESSSDANMQFVDMLAGIVQSYFEDNKVIPYNILSTHNQFILKKLYF